MIANIALQTQIASLEKERFDMIKRKNDLVVEIKGTGITKQAYWKARRGMVDIDPELIKKHENLTVQYQEIESTICNIKSKLVLLHRKRDAAQKPVFMGVLNEIFSKEQMQEIGKEAERRMNGEEPQKVLFNLDAAQNLVEDVDKWKKMYAGELDKIQEVRILLNRVIEDGCKQFGDAQFMKVISPLNRYILPLNELKKLKRQIFPRDYLVK